MNSRRRVTAALVALLLLVIGAWLIQLVFGDPAPMPRDVGAVAWLCILSSRDNGVEWGALTLISHDNGVSDSDSQLAGTQEGTQL